MQIERGASNTFALLGRSILSPSYWLLWFRDPERNASVYCIATASNTTGGMLTLTFTETNTPIALNGQVKLSPRGNWELKVYEQTSATNLNPANAGRLVKTIGILVTGPEANDTGWSGSACPPGGGDCDPVTIVDQDDTLIAEVPSGTTYQVIVVSGIDGGLSNTTYTNSIIQP